MLFVGAIARGDARVGTDVISPRGTSASALGAYDATGTYVWSRVLDRTAAASDGAVDIASLAVLDRETVVVTGSYYGTVDFGGGGVDSTFDSAGMYSTRDVFVAHYRASDRLYLRERSYGDLGDQYGTQIAVGPGGSVNIAGWFSGTIDFGSSTRSVPAGSSWPFVARLVD